MHNSGWVEEYTLKFRISHYLLEAFFVVIPVSTLPEPLSFQQIDNFVSYLTKTHTGRRTFTHRETETKTL